jgi:hypothetical protein
MASTSTTRGVSFDPATAAAERERRQAQEQRERAEVGRLRARAQAGISDRKQHAIKLDQIERCYRERGRS